MTLLTPTKTSLSEFYTAAAYSNTGLLLSPRSSRFCRTAKASAAACSPSAAFGGTSHRLSGPRHVSASISASVSASVSASISASVAGRCSTPYKAESAPVTAEDRSDHVDIKTRHPPSSPASSDVSLAAVTTPTKGNSGLRKECNLNRGSSATDNIPASMAASTFTPTASGSLMSQFQRQMALTPKRASPKDGRAATSAFSLLPLLNQGRQSPKPSSLHQLPLPSYPYQSSQNIKSVRSLSNGVGCIVSSPGVRRSKSKITTYDRFIPNRDAMDSASSHFAGIKEPLDRQKPLDAEAIAYQEQLARACGVAIDQRILAYNVEPPGVERQDLRTTWNRPLRAPNVKLAKRRIPTMADKVLDAPGLIDDFYLSLLDWSSNNQLAIALDKSVYIWNADTGGVQEFCQTADDDFVTSLQWTADGSYLAIGTDNGDAQIWDLDSSSKIRTMRGRNSRVGVLSWDKHVLSSGSRDGSIWHHDVRIANHKVAELIGHSSEVCGLKWRPDGQLLASGGNDNLVNIWDVRSTTPKFTKTEHTAAVKAMAWCPWQLNLLATGGGSSDQMVHFWNTTSTGKVSSFNTGSQVTSIIWSREYKELLTSHGFPNNHLSIWSYPSLNKIADLSGHDSRVLHTAISPDGQTVASTASDENLKFWKAFESRKGKTTQSKRGSSADDVDEALTKTYSRMTIR